MNFMLKKKGDRSDDSVEQSINMREEPENNKIVVEMRSKLRKY